jgi:hypothetical protein
MIKIRVDELNRDIHIGEWKVPKYTLYKNNNEDKVEFLYNVFNFNDISTKIPFPSKANNWKFNHKENKIIGDLLGVSRDRLFKHYSSLSYKLWVADVRDYVDLLGRRVGGRIHRSLLQAIWERKELLDELKEDNLWNIMPICFYFNMHPSEIKKHLGKSTWKKLCKNTKSRNKTLVSALINTSEAICEICDLRTGTLKYLSKVCCEIDLLDLFENMAANSKILTNFTKMSRLHSILLDSVHRLGIRPKKVWDYEKLKEVHDRAAIEKSLERERKKNELFKKPFKFKYAYPETISFGEYRATLLKSPEELHEEGKEMRHCVGSFAGSVQNGYVLIYSVENTDLKKKSSTLEIRLHDLSIGQHYAKFNEEVVNPLELTLAEIVLDKVAEVVNNYNTTQKIGERDERFAVDVL